MDATAEIRRATPADAEGIARMHERNGMEAADTAALLRSCQTYPLADHFGNDLPLGWVLEKSGSVVGSLGNVPILYELDGQLVKAAVATAWAVDPAYRGKSVALMMSFLRQPGIDLWLNGSANAAASQVMTGLKLARMPIPDYALPCFWAVRGRAFAEAVLKRKGMPAAAWLAWPAGMLLGVVDTLRGSGRGRISQAVKRLPGFDDRWDGFWRALSAGPTRLRAVRTRAVMEWRFGAGVRAGNTAILSVESAGDLTGYAVLVRRRGEDLGLSLYDIADIQALRDDAETIRDLVRAAVRAAREDGADAVKMVSGTPAKRGPLAELRPYTYELPFWQLYFKAANDLKAKLSRADAWDFSLFETY